ncbi:hypothetical protein TNCV_831191 [Trichonephila clavipes]|nr:hypothetical protein TNCV_831191 [Trichonephila clavipes]
MLCMVVFFEKLEEFRIICLQATCDGHRLRIGFSLPPYTIITHSVKRRQSVEPVCANGLGSNPGESMDVCKCLRGTSDPQPPVRGLNGAGPPKEH